MGKEGPQFGFESLTAKKMAKMPIYQQNLRE